jgi:hypothetical protein
VVSRLARFGRVKLKPDVRFMAYAGPEAACQDTTTFRAPRPIVRFLTVATFTAAIATYKPSDIIALSRAAITDRGC